MGKLGDIDNDNQEGKDEISLAIPLKHLNNFWRSLKMPLINCEIELILNWSTNRVILSNTRRDGSNIKPTVNVSATNATFKITETKLNVPVVTLSTKNDKTLLEQLRTGFERTIKCNKYRSEMTNQTKNNNLNYLIDPTFTKVNRLLASSFENKNDRPYF